MKTTIIIVLLVIAEILSVAILHTLHTKREARLIASIERKNEQIDELGKTIELLKQKLQFKAINDAFSIQEKKLKQQLADNAAKQAQQKALEEKIKKEQTLKKLNRELLHAKKQLALLPTPKKSVSKINPAILLTEIEKTELAIKDANKKIELVNTLNRDEKYKCYSTCIAGRRMNFHRLMTRTCKSDAQGGLYFCTHYDIAGTDFCTRHRKSHKRWKFPAGYRDDHHSDVNYLCKMHNMVWDKETATRYAEIFNNSYFLPGKISSIKIHLSKLKIHLNKLNKSYRQHLSVQKHNETAFKAETAKAARQKELLQKKINELELAISKLIANP